MDILAMSAEQMSNVHMPYDRSLTQLLNLAYLSAFANHEQFVIDLLFFFLFLVKFFFRQLPCIIIIICHPWTTWNLAIEVDLFPDFSLFWGISKNIPWANYNVAICIFVILFDNSKISHMYIWRNVYFILNSNLRFKIL